MEAGRRIGSMSQPVVVFGGSFDPVHHGHLIIARAIAEQRGFERVTFVPTGRPPHKPAPATPAEVRLEMLRAAVELRSGYDVCDLEVRREGPSYTFDTIAELRRIHGAGAVIHWVIGADMLEDLHRWRRAGEVLEAANLLVALRPPWDQQMPSLLEKLREHFPAGQVERLVQGVVRTPLIDISSTEIRRRVAAGRPIDFLVPDAVAAIIRRRGLYVGDPRA
jgi:nicotinate-nucleotide adenylyltransferase